jgi:nitroreductase
MTRTGIDETAFRDAVAAAVQAPSLHNSQPWRFRLRADTVEVLVDRDRGLPASDPTGWAMRIACGAATFNMRLAFAMQGHPVDVHWQPSRTDSAVMAAMTPVARRPASPLEQRLYHAIPRRHSNRQPFWPESVPVEARAGLAEAARAESAWLELVTGTASVGAVAEIAHAANQVLRRNAGYMAELAAWTRPDDANNDGVPAPAGGPSPEPQDLLPQRPFDDRARAPGRDFEPEPLVAVLGTEGNLPNDELCAGHALERVLLTLTDLGLAASCSRSRSRCPPHGNNCASLSGAMVRRRCCFESGTASRVPRHHAAGLPRSSTQPRPEMGPA